MSSRNSRNGYIYCISYNIPQEERKNMADTMK